MRTLPRRTLRLELLHKGDEISDLSLDRFCRELETFFEDQDTHMSSVPNLLASRGVASLDAKILLPSSFSKELLEKYGLTRLADLEYKVREADAFEAIHSLKMSLREITYLVGRYRTDGLGRKNATRSVSAQQQAHARKRLYEAQYRLAYGALVKLGLTNDTSELRPLTAEDTYRPSLQEPHELGSGTKPSGWIWSISHGGKKTVEWVKEGKLLLSFSHLARLTSRKRIEYYGSEAAQRKTAGRKKLF